MHLTMNIVRLFSALLAIAGSSSAEPAYQLSWIGNSGSAVINGQKRMRLYVQMDAKDAFVLPDGTVAALTWFEEGHQELGLYKDGGFVTAMPKTHYQATLAVTADETHVYMAGRSGGKKGTLTNYIRKYERFKSDKYLDTEISSHKEFDPILGLAISGDTLFVSDPLESKIRLLDKTTMKESSSFTVENPRKISVDKQKRIWVIIGGAGESNTNPGKGAIIRAYTPDGRPVPDSEIRDIAVPTAIAIDNQGRLLLADSEPGVNHIAIYDISSRPSRVGTFGKCITSGTPGEVKPDKFDHITGMGTDKEGNYYVLWNGGPHAGSGRTVSEAQGLVIQSLNPDGTGRWQLLGGHFIDSADADPDDETKVYSRNARYDMDYSKPPGKQFTFKAHTLDRKRYPHDPRLWHSHLYASQTLRLQGKLFMILQDQYRDTNTMFRFDGEIAVPAVMFSGKFPWMNPPNRPEGMRKFLWRDGSGASAPDGQFAADEYHELTNFAWGFASWSKNGDVWCVSSKGNQIARYPFLGLDPNGIPKYSEETSVVIPKPAEFHKIANVEYDSDKDVMFIAGFLKKEEEKDYGGGTGKTNFRWIFRYDNWSKSQANPIARSKMKLPEVVQVAFTFSGDWIFAGERQGQPIRVFDSRDGKLVQHWKPDRKVGGPDWYGGGLDVPRAIRAYQRKNGEILVFSEEVSYSKVLMHQWTPK